MLTGRLLIRFTVEADYRSGRPCHVGAEPNTGYSDSGPVGVAEDRMAVLTRKRLVETPPPKKVVLYGFDRFSR